jgi:hypothetical protein
MPDYGLKVFDADGDLRLDTTSDLPKVLDTRVLDFNTDYTFNFNGSGGATAIPNMQYWNPDDGGQILLQSLDEVGGEPIADGDYSAMYPRIGHLLESEPTGYNWNRTLTIKSGYIDSYILYIPNYVVTYSDTLMILYNTTSSIQVG